MKIIDTKSMDNHPGKHLLPTDLFRFHCHPGVDCYNRCCRNLNLFLSPFDILRLKNHMGVSSDDFLENNVDVVLKEGAHFPDVLLTMREGDDMSCPFVTTAGCSVYENRPNACRTFPLEQGLWYPDGPGEKSAAYFFRPPEFCRGHISTDTGPENQTNNQIVRQWIASQQPSEYLRMTTKWAELKVRFQNDPRGTESPGGKRFKMAFMAAYNIDAFRAFVFNSSFLKRYKVTKNHANRIRLDDKALLLFGFEWIRLFLWNIRSNIIRPRSM